MKFLNMFESAKMVNLGHLISRHKPEEWVMSDILWGMEDEEYPVKLCKAPGELKTVGGDNEKIKNLVDLAQEGETWDIVQGYRNTPSTPEDAIILSKGRIVDGNHRAMAAYLDKRPIYYIEVGEA